MATYGLSESTAAALQELLAEVPGTGGAGVRGGKGTRQQVCYVQCASWTSGEGTCTVQEFNASTSAWTAFGSASNTKLLSAQGTPLTVGRRYLAIRYGVTSYPPKVVFVAFGSGSTEELTFGCGLVEIGGEVTFDAGYVAGAGLVASGCTLNVNLGCGLDTDLLTGAITLDAPTVAGAGLYSYTGCSLDVDIGCGLMLEAGQVAVDLDTIKGQGLKVFPASGEEDCPTIGIDPGCHITLVGGDKVAVDVGGMPGCGLKVEEGDTCDMLAFDAYAVAGDGLIPSGCELHVNTGCGLDIHSGTGAVVIDTVPASSYTFSAITAQTLAAEGCGFTLTSTVTSFELITNSCGVVIGFEPTATFTNSSSVAIDPSACGSLCTYCTGYGNYGTGGGGGGGVDYCWDGTMWVVCVDVPPVARGDIQFFDPPTFV